MARKKRKEQSPEKTSFLRDSCHRDTYKDLQRKAITLGMPFPDVPISGVFDLIKYINRPDTPDPNPDLIDEYDKWVIQQLDIAGLPEDDPLRNSRLRLGFIGDTDKEGNVIKRKRVPGIKKTKIKKPAKERDEFNLFKGTKKSYTWELTKKGYSLDRIIRRVIKKFPDANDKSIKLWYRACLREIKKKKNGKG